MKRILLIGMLIVVAAIAAVAGCGFHGFPPMGCKDSDAVCICDANGNCRWEWHCR